MKSIDETIKRVDREDLKTIAKIVKIKSASPGSVLSAIQSVSGLDSILSILTMEELQIFSLIYTGHDGITFGEIEKKLKLSIDSIETSIESLSSKLLVHHIKNRQLLTNKMDKVYGLKEMNDTIHITEAGEIKKQLLKVSAALVDGKKPRKLPQSALTGTGKNFLTAIIRSGGILSLSSIKPLYSNDKAFERQINTFLKNSIVSLYHTTHEGYEAYCIINEDYALSAAKLLSDDSGKKSPSVHNRYGFLLNLLNTFDCISTYGLFLTKQMHFRKIDIKRIEESLSTLYDYSGNEFSRETLSRLSLHILFRLKCLSIHKDTAVISLKNIKKKLMEPQNLTSKLLNIPEGAPKPEEHFPCPINIPDNRTIINIYRTIWKLKETSYSYLLACLLGEATAEAVKKGQLDIKNTRHTSEEIIKSSLNYLCLLGIIKSDKGVLSVSDIGEEVGAKILNIKIPEKEKKESRTIYINPDFTVYIPKDTINSKDLYHLLTHTEIVKEDVAIHAAISKSSIVKAHKRGLPLKHFVDTLRAHSKNALPQNLDFLLNEWSKQTIRLQISHAIIMRVSHPEFLDEITFGNLQKAIIERIGPNHAIIKKEYIDNIVKTAQKNDAVISLFEGFEE